LGNKEGKIKSPPLQNISLIFPQKPSIFLGIKKKRRLKKE
jgi:hypothetical protein